MRLENIVKIVVPAFFAANTAYANEANLANQKEIGEIININDHATGASQNNKDDWDKQKRLITEGYATVLIEPVQDKSGYCVVGLDGFPQKYDLPADKRTNDKELEKSERILNLSESNPENKFYFSCDRKVEVPKIAPATPITPTPIVPETPKAKTLPEKLPFLMFSPGASYLQIFAAEDKTYGFDGNLYGGSLSLTVQPSYTNWYGGGRFSVYGNSSSKSEDITVPTTEGLLAGKLVLQGKNDYHLGHFGIGIGAMFGYMIPFDKKGKFGLGLELEPGFIHDRVTREFKESSAHYIQGNLVEGTNISNHSDDNGTQVYGYGMGGLRLKLPYICINLSGGARTDLNGIQGMFSAGVAYCPNKK